MKKTSRSMEQINCEETRQEALDLKCQQILPGVEKSDALSPSPVKTSGIVGNLNSETEIASLTPQKTSEPLHANFKEKEINLPDKYKTIAEFFDRMNCSLRLLGLRKKPTTFQNICTQVEILTKRKFSYRHLAQIKYILPEVVQIDYILIHDVKSLCMKPDMKISLLFDVIEGHQEKSTFMALRQVFAYRLLDFFNTHPEGCDIPEAILPEPFNQRTQNIIPKSLPVDSSIESQPTSEVELLADSSHLNPSFRRQFSEKAVVAETGKNQLLASLVPLLSSSDIVTNKDTKSKQHKESSELYSESTIIKPPVGLICPQSSVSSSACESPYLKHRMVSDCLMVETPAQLTPKRSMPSCDNKLKTVTRQMGTSCHMPTKRSLDFSRLEDDESVLNTLDEPECHKVIHDTLSQTVEAKGVQVEEEASGSVELLQKVEESNDCTGNAHEMKQRVLVTSQQVSTCLVDLVALIHHIFLSLGCFSITKEELVHKIIMNNCDIIERREIEEQIELLEKLIPEWIFRKLAPCGDLLYSIRKESNLDSVCARLCNVGQDCHRGWSP